LFSHFESEEPINFTFNHNIIDVLIGDILFNLEDDDEDAKLTCGRALSIFKKLEDAADGVIPQQDGEQNLYQKAYKVEIRKVSRFKMVHRLISKGATFCSTSRFVEVSQMVCKSSFLAGCSEGICGLDS